MALPIRPDPGARVPASPPAPARFAAPAERELDLRDLSRGVRRSRWWILATAGVVVALGALATWLKTPVYESEATIQMGDSDASSGLLGSLSGVPGLGSLSALEQGSVGTEIAVLESRSLAETVVDSLALRVRLLKPEGPRDEVLTVVSAPRDERHGVYELSRRPDGSYGIRAEEGPAPRPAAIRPGGVADLAGAKIRLRNVGESAGAERIRIGILSFRGAVGAFQKSLSVTQVGGGAQVLSITARDRDPVLAAAIPNAIAVDYVAYKSGTGRSSAASSVHFLQQQVDQYARQLAEAEAKLQHYNEAEGIVSLPDQSAAQVRQVADVKARRDMMVTEREALRGLLSTAESAPRSDTTVSPYRRLATFPTFLSNGIVQNLERTLTDLETQRSELLSRFTPDHPDVRQVNERIDEIEAQLHQIAKHYMESLNSEIASMDATLGRFSRDLVSAPQTQIEYARLVRQQQLLQDVYTLLETRLKEAQIQEAGEPINVRVLDSALVPDKPISPRPLLALALSVVVGLLLGVGVGFLRTIFDPTVRSRNDVIRASGGAPVLAAIPRLSNGSGSLRRPGSGNGSRSALRPAGVPDDPNLVAIHAPASLAAEAFRGLRTSITVPGAERVRQVIVTTSAMPGEGKSVSAANLAVALAQQGIPTLLVDADLRQGSLHRLFGLERSPGLADVLLERAASESAVHEIATPPPGRPLHVLAAGAPTGSPSELLGSDAMLRFLDRARARYEMVILDAPPVQVVTDAAVLGTLADHTLLVARAGTTHKRDLAEATAELQRLGISVGGIVVNEVEAVEVPYYPYGPERAES